MLFSNLLCALFAPAVVLGAPIAPILDAVGDIIADNFIVVLNPQSQSAFSDFLNSRDAALVSATKDTFSFGDFQGFTGVFSSSLLDTIRTLAQVKYIEPVTKVQASALTSQANAPWGLSRISHRNLGATNYIYDTTAGQNTFAYVIDTGIYTAHVEFEGRATFGANFAGDGQNTDGNGHGTHVAGTIGSRAYGVAKKTQLIGVKVLDASGSGSSAGVIQGIQWAVNDAKSKGRIGRAVANLSLGGAFSQASNDAVAAGTREGVFFGVAAGNSAVNARTASPASEPLACTVGATDKTDAMASYSNYGSIVDIFAPGSEIISTWIGGPTNTNTISGTSMATPHVVGLASYLIAIEGAKAPAALCDRIKALSTKNKIRLSLVAALSGSPNALAYNGNGAQ